MKQVIILLHGALGASKQLIPLSEYLIENFEVYSFDFEGHSENRSSANFSIDLFVQNTIDFMRENGIGSANFFGYSMGGYVALKLALEKPLSVESVFTYGTKFDWTPESSTLEVKMLNPEKIESKIPHFAEYLSNVQAPNDWKIVMQKTAEMLFDLGNGKALNAFDLQKIKLPTQIGIGSKDQMVSIQESKKATEQLSNATLIVMEDMLHPIEKVDLQKLSEAITTFIKLKSPLLRTF